MYSQDYRKHVISTLEKGYSVCQVASNFGISKTTIQNCQKDINPKESSAGRHEKINSKALLKDVEDNPDAYQHERAERFNCSASGISRCLKGLNISKKNS